MYGIYHFLHSMDICFWEVPSVLVIIAMVVMLAVHLYNQKQREEEFADRMNRKQK